MKHRRSLSAIIFAAFASLFFSSCDIYGPVLYGPFPYDEDPGQEAQDTTKQDSDTTDVDIPNDSTGVDNPE